MPIHTVSWINLKLVRVYANNHMTTSFSKYNLIVSRNRDRK